MSGKPLRSIMDLDLEELESVLANNALPEDVGLQGIETHREFKKLFRNRANPMKIAETLLKEKAGVTTKRVAQPYQAVIDPAIRSERVELKRKELALREEKYAKQTQMNQLIHNKLLLLEQGQNLTVSSLTNLNDKVDNVLDVLQQLLERTRS